MRWMSWSGAGAAAGIGLLLAGIAGCTQSQEAEAPAASEAALAAAPSVERGEYIVRTGGCDDCHTPKMMTDQGPVLDPQLRLSGHPSTQAVAAVPSGALSPDGWVAMTNGSLTAWVGPWGVSFSANLTPDPTGIGDWTEAEFVGALRSGKHMGTGRPLLPPMPWQSAGQLNDTDLGSIFLYLKTLAPVANTVPQPIPPGM